MANFVQSNIPRLLDANSAHSQLDYCGIIQDILQVDYRKFKFFVFDVKWFKVVYSGRGATVRRDASGFFAIDSTKLWTDARDTLVFPEQCEQVCIDFV